jgi:hypothetical protein
VAEEGHTDADLLHQAPHSAPVRWVDEVQATGELILFLHGQRLTMVKCACVWWCPGRLSSRAM